MPTHRRRRPLAAAPRRPQTGRSRYFTLWRHGRAPSAPHNPALGEHTVVTVVARVSWSSPPPMGAAHAVRRTQHRVACWASHTRRWPTAVVVAGADLTPVSNVRPPRRPRAFESTTRPPTYTTILQENARVRARIHRSRRRRRRGREAERLSRRPWWWWCCCCRDLHRRPPPPLYPAGALTPSLLRTCAERPAVPCVCVSAAAAATARGVFAAAPPSEPLHCTRCG